MKKILTLILLAASASGLYAQGLYEGLIFSQNTYYGTARSMALGNAMTAVGGDLGSIVINPAGSAVSSYSQFLPAKPAMRPFPERIRTAMRGPRATPALTCRTSA